MRRVLLTAVAVAPLLALAGVAEAACPAAGTATSGSNLVIDSTCTITPPAGGAGLVLNSDNTITTQSGSKITNTDADNSVGILIQGTHTGSVDSGGAISLLMSYVPATEGNTGLPGGAFATGSNRVAIELTGGTLTGSVTVESTGPITVSGNNSTGILIRSCMIARKRSRAAGSSRAWPRSVSMKPVSEASGVRSSWLALARKSARVRSERRSSVSSRKVSNASRPPAALASGRAVARHTRSCAPPAA